MLTRRGMMATGYGWLAFSGISGIVGYFTIQSIDDDQKRHINDDITYLRQQRGYYETTQLQFYGTSTYDYYGDMARFTQEEIDAREQWKRQSLFKRTFGKGLYLGDAVMNTERRAGAQVRLRNNLVGEGANTRVDTSRANTSVNLQGRGLQTISKD